MNLSLLIILPLVTAIAVLFCRGLKQVRTVSLIGASAQFLSALGLLWVYWKERAAGNNSQFLFDFNYTWFTPTQLGAFDIQCTVNCGLGHADMLSKVIVVPVTEFEAWYFSDAVSLPSPLPAGSAHVSAEAQNPAVAILESKSCLTCHSLDGKVMVGPTFNGGCGREKIVLANGLPQSVPCDEAYLARAIQSPMAEIVKGYPPTMPSNPLGAEELKQAIHFLLSFK